MPKVGFLDRIRRIFEPGEKLLFEEIERLVSLAVRAVKNIDRMIELELSVDVEALKHHARVVADLEKEGDEITLAVTEEVARGTLAVGLREDFTELLQKVDSILDTAHVLAREIVRTVEFTPIKGKGEMEGIFKLVSKLSGLAVDSVEKLSDMLESARRIGEEAVKISFEIERMEERGDEIKEEVLDRVYGISNEIRFQDFYHLINITHRLDNIIDGCEDSSNTIETIIKSLTY